MADLDGSVYVLPPVGSAGLLRRLLPGAVYELGAALGEGEPPVTTLVSPTSGGVDPTTPVVVDVTDPDSGFRRIFLVVVLGGEAFLAYDGVKFRNGFEAFSTRSNITDGFRFSLRRNAGWRGAVSVEVYPIDDTGIEGV